MAEHFDIGGLRYWVAVAEGRLPDTEWNIGNMLAANGISFSNPIMCGSSGVTAWIPVLVRMCEALRRHRSWMGETGCHRQCPCPSSAAALDTPCSRWLARDRQRRRDSEYRCTADSEGHVEVNVPLRDCPN